MLFHWLIAAFIAVNLLLVWAVDSMPKTAERPMVNLHKSIGLTVLGLAIMRLLWRWANPPPALPRGYGRWERLGAHWAHVALYVLIFALPITGWIHDSAWKNAAANPLTLYGFVPWFRIGLIANQDAATKEQIHSVFFTMHGLLAYALYGLFVLHVSGALKHQWINRQPALQRMLPGGPLPSDPGDHPIQG